MKNKLFSKYSITPRAFRLPLIYLAKLKYSFSQIWQTSSPDVFKCVIYLIMYALLVSWLMVTISINNQILIMWVDILPPPPPGCPISPKRAAPGGSIV